MNAIFDLALAAPGVAVFDANMGALAPVVVGGGTMMGGGGRPSETRRFAATLEPRPKQTKAHKKQVQRALITEALLLLPDMPQAPALASALAGIVARTQAATLAPWQPIRALMPVPLPCPVEAQLAALVADWRKDGRAPYDAANDEHETELLLLGAA